MRTKVLPLLMLALCAFASAQTTSPQTPIPEDPGAKKARALLDQMIQAMGGDAFLTYSDMSQQGRAATFYHGTPEGTSYPYWYFWKWPDLDRTELSKQRDIVYVHNGDKGYEITFKGTRAQDAKDLEEYNRVREHAVQTVLRRWLKEPGTLLFYDGVGIADQKQVNKVTVMNAKNDSVTFWIDSFSHLLVKKSYQWREPDTRYFNEEAEVYGNYHAVQGVQTPRSSVSLHNGDMTRQRFIDSTTYNTGLADTMFQANVTYDPTVKKPRK